MSGNRHTEFGIFQRGSLLLSLFFWFFYHLAGVLTLIIFAPILLLKKKTYIDKNLEIASKIFPLADSGLNKLTIAKTLNITWDKVKYSLINREHFELRLLEN